MPDPTTIRLDPALKAAILADAKMRGIDNLSEWVRQAAAFQLGWVAAVRAASAGASLDTLGDPNEVARLIASVVPHDRTLIE